MRAGIAAFAGGVILLYCVGRIPPLPLLWFVLIASTTISFLNQRLRLYAIILSCLLAGLCWASWSASERLTLRLSADPDLQLQTVEGYRCSLVAPGAYDSLRFDFCVTRWLDAKKTVKKVTKLRLALYGAEQGLVLPTRLRLTVRLKEPRGSVNPEGFRYETWLFRHGFGATGSIREWQVMSKIDCGAGCRYHEKREAVANALARHYDHLEAYPMMEALLLGERRLLKSQDWAIFKATGTSHLIAISGLHIGLIGLFTGWLTTRLLTCVSSRFMSSRRRRRTVVAVSLVACLVYALLAGFTVPTQRALVMAVVAAVVYLRSRLSGYWTAWLVALGGVLLLDPFAPLDGGFWLSFGAVGCLIMLFAGRLEAPGPVKALLQAQAAVTAGLLPVLSGLGLPSAALGWLVNIIAIPLMSFLLLPLVFVLTPLGMVSDIMFELSAPVLEFVLGNFIMGLAWFAGISPEGIHANAAIAVLIAAAVTGCLLPLGRLSRGILTATAGLCLAGTLAIPSGNSVVAHPELWVWDVGQGLSVLYRQKDQVLLYDTGPGSPSGYTAVDSVLRPNLRTLGIKSIDLLVVSHGDADHASGLGALLDHVPVKRFLTGEPERLAKVYPGLEPCKSGTWLDLDGLQVELWQSPGGKAGNSRSCVLRIVTAQAEIILPGDITAEDEQRWLADHQVTSGLPRVVVAPHHGSNTSSSSEWVNTLQPDVVLFSAGYRHPYGHPAEPVQARYRATGADPYNTATSGAVRIKLLEGTLRVNSTREHAPFWIIPPPRRLPEGPAEGVAAGPACAKVARGCSTSGR